MSTLLDLSEGFGGLASTKVVLADIEVIRANDLHEDPVRFAAWLSEQDVDRSLEGPEFVNQLRNLAEVELDAFIYESSEGDESDFAYEYYVELSGVSIPEEIDWAVDWAKVWSHGLRFDFTAIRLWDEDNTPRLLVWANN